jgi:hypothetical protein
VYVLTRYSRRIFLAGKHHLLLTPNCISFVVQFVPANAPMFYSL